MTAVYPHHERCPADTTNVPQKYMQTDFLFATCRIPARTFVEGA